MAKVLDHDSDHRGYLDLNKKELRNVRLQNLGADIASPVDGLIFYRSDTDKIRAYINGSWEDLATMDDVTAGGISSTIVDAKGDLIVGSGADTVIREAVGADGTFYVADSAQTGGHIWRAIAVGDIANDLITYAKIQNISATDRLLGRDTAAAGDIEELTVTGGVEFTGSGGIRTSAFTGDVTKAAGGTATTIAANVVTLAKMATLAANSIIGNNTGSAATPIALTVAQVKALLAIVPGDITGFDTQVRTSRLDQMAAPTAAVSMNSQKITNLADGTATTDAINLGQLQAAVEGRGWKDPVKAASTANLTLSGTQTVDGVALVAGDRVLVKNQTATQDNGIYLVAAGAWTRALDANSVAEVNDATVLVEGGTVGAGDVYTQTATIVTLGTTGMTWTKTGEGNTVYTADGTTITLTGTSFGVTAGGIGATQLAAAVAGNGLAGGAGTALSVNVDATTIEISSDTVRIAATAAGAGLTGGGGSALAVGAGTGITVNANDVALDTAVAVRKFAADCAAATSTVVTHNLNTRDVTVSVYRSTTPWDEIECEVEHTSVNTVTVRFLVAPTAAEFRIVVHG